MTGFIKNGLKQHRVHCTVDTNTHTHAHMNRKLRGSSVDVKIIGTECLQVVVITSQSTLITGTNTRTRTHTHTMQCIHTLRAGEPVGTKRGSQNVSEDESKRRQSTGHRDKFIRPLTKR